MKKKNPNKIHNFLGNLLERVCRRLIGGNEGHLPSHHILFGKAQWIGVCYDEYY